MDNRKLALFLALLFLLLALLYSYSDKTSTSKSHSPLLPSFDRASSPSDQVPLLSTTHSELDKFNQPQIYIVHVVKPAGWESYFSVEDRERWHASFLPYTPLDSGKPRMIYSYSHVISGFSAWLTPQEVKHMESMDGFLHAEPDELLQLLTTHTPDVLKLTGPGGAWQPTDGGSGIIVGVLDTGILPGHPSFDGHGIPPPPAKWKGRCDFSPPSCNNKLIGATAFHGGSRPLPIDRQGHGTHVAGIAAGNEVPVAEVLGNAYGTAEGMAPRVHLAIYKVCFDDGCSMSDVLAGMDTAIGDGVDVLSMSFGRKGPKPMYDDSVARGTYAAIVRGIFPCTTAGNSGPEESTLSHDAPWVMTVGATTTDRRIRATVKLGNGTEMDGESAYQPNSLEQLPLVFPGSSGKQVHLYCSKLDDVDVKGKIVMCYTGLINNIEKGDIVNGAGGAAMILMNQKNRGFTTRAEAHHLPVSHVSYKDGLTIISYVKGSTTPTAAIIFKGTVFGVRPSPAVASFSSRGPSLDNGGILKPDIIAPGVNILSAWPFHVGPQPNGSQDSTFNFLSGTSMAAPHVSGVAALIKKLHPDWSPAAILSAVITSADTSTPYGGPIVDESSDNYTTASLFARGAGFVNPLGALHTSLIYNITPNQYLSYLCGLGYTDQQLTLFTHYPYHCTTNISAEQLNYPSISLSLGSVANKSITRTVTNVGSAPSFYSANIDEPVGVSVELSTNKLEFNESYQEIAFDIRFSIKGARPSKGSTSQGALSWVADHSTVTSPISISFD